MIKRTLYFGNPAYLCLKNAQLEFRSPEIEKSEYSDEELKKKAVVTVPIEDIGIVIIDHQQITITQGLLDALLENNSIIITCDKTHHPTGLLMPLCGHTIQNERFRSQIDATEPLKKQLWAQTVSQKIKNQAAVLYSRGIKNDYLIPLYKDVKSGDTQNVEGTAAAYYWKNIFPHIPGFVREREGLPPNNILNYGYAILRATMARSIVGSGLLPTLGIHHHNRYNAYCLADDLMEPYRPVVDMLSCDLIQEHGADVFLSQMVKKALLQIPAIDVFMNGERSPLMNATQRTAVSLVKCFSGETRKIIYPEME
jgi:CRISP-associated protein Cas1